MNHTPNYQLNLWEGEDRILREDFNADNTKIEAALASAGNCKIATGSYVGTGTYGASNPTSLTFEFQPLMILLDPGEIEVTNSVPRYYFLYRSCSSFSACKSSGSVLPVTWSANGASWYATLNALQQFNTKGQTYHYLAIGV